MAADFESVITLAFGNGANDIHAAQPAVRKQSRLLRTVVANILGVEVDTIVAVYVLRDPD